MEKARTAIGVDIGGTNIRAARVSADGTVLARAGARSSPNPQTVLERVEALIAEVDDPTVEGIGIGIPGQVDLATRRVLSGGYVDLSGFPVCARIEERFRRPTVIDNDASMALIAEARCGAASGRRNTVMLTIGTGIGGAILSDGAILRGAGTAGQLGHLVVDPSGPLCKCGRRGCVETFSSGTALAQLVARANEPAHTTAAELLARRDTGDTAAERILRDWTQPLRAAIDSLSATLNPEMVVLGGGLGAEAFAALSAHPEQSGWFTYKVAPASLGDDAGVIGAALAALSPTARSRKRLVMVNGVPASGKSHVATVLAQATGWPLLSLDTIKNPFLEEIGNIDRPTNRKLGRASLRAMLALLRDAPDGTTAIMDAWFGFQPREFAQDLIEEAGIGAIAEIWCTTAPDIIGARYAARAASRPTGHPGAEYVPELVALADRAEPSRFGPVHAVDTALPFEPGPALDFIEAAFGNPRLSQDKDRFAFRG